MGSDDKVTFVHTEKDGRLVFHRADGSEGVVTAKGYETDDPADIALLDSFDFIKRQGSKSAAKEE
jgi:hypothetical protein